MKQEALKFFSDTHLTALGLLIFFGFFVGVLLWVYRKSSTNIYAQLEQLPLKDGDK
ncbi:Cbb3-type cytochrome oxidase component FixQ [compost metagenome]